MSSISPVAILAIMMALPMASAGRFLPLGPLGAYTDFAREDSWEKVCGCGDRNSHCGHH